MVIHNTMPNVGSKINGILLLQYSVRVSASVYISLFMFEATGSRSKWRLVEVALVIHSGTLCCRTRSNFRTTKPEMYV